VSGERKFVGTTTECMQELYKDRKRTQRLALDKLMGAFCGIEAEAVHKWQPNFESMRGISLLRARCFLHLAGYEVRELDGLSETARSLALMVGLNVIEDLYDLQRRIGFEAATLGGLYRVILRNESYSNEVAANVATLVNEHAATLTATMKAKRKEVREGLESINRGEHIIVVQQTSTQVAPVDPATVTAFWRAAGMTVALGMPLADNPEAISMLRAISAGGPELYELRELLDKLLE
jgi:hypothetical protein